jgi:hypothetical protein
MATIPAKIAHLRAWWCEGNDLEVQSWLTVSTGFRGRGLRLTATVSLAGAARRLIYWILLCGYALRQAKPLL